MREHGLPGLEVDPGLVQRATLAVADADHEVRADEEVDLTGLDRILLVDVPERLEHEEQAVVVALELRTLVGVDGVLDGQRVQREGLRDLVELGRVGLVQADPDEVAGSGSGRAWRPGRPRRSRPAPGFRRGRPRCRRSRSDTSPSTVPGMATLVLVRHARSTANASGVLTGRLTGVHLDETGGRRRSAPGSGSPRSRSPPLVSSPLERCKETARALAAEQPQPVRIATDRGLVECDYGDWQGRPLKELARVKLWKVVQRHPASVTFPGGESMAAMSARAVAAVRRHDALVEAEHGPQAVWAAVSHGDLVKAILADALGLHLDQFQRLHVDPASISVIRYAPDAAYVLQTNSHAGDLGWLAPRTRQGAAHRRVVGGGAGPSGAAP